MGNRRVSNDPFHPWGPGAGKTSVDHSFTLTTDTATLVVGDPAFIRAHTRQDADWWSQKWEARSEQSRGQVTLIRLGGDEARRTLAVTYCASDKWLRLDQFARSFGVACWDRISAARAMRTFDSLPRPSLAMQPA
jgi:hypothetical protein